MLKYFETHNKLSWTITILIAITIFYISTQTFPYGSPGPEFKLKPLVYHFLAFFFLNYFLLISITNGKNKKLIPLAITLTILYAILDEIHQSFVPNRSASILDILIDTIGILTATIIYARRFRK